MPAIHVTAQRDFGALEHLKSPHERPNERNNDLAQQLARIVTRAGQPRVDLVAELAGQMIPARPVVALPMADSRLDHDATSYHFRNCASHPLGYLANPIRCGVRSATAPFDSQLNDWACLVMAGLAWNLEAWTSTNRLAGCVGENIDVRTSE